VQLVDTVDVAPHDLERYLDLLHGRTVPVMNEAGASFVSCATTDPALDPVTVQVVWGFDDFVQWNDIRRRLVVDPRWYEVADEAAALRRSGTRRFYRPAAGPGPGPAPD